ncbi:MAG: hypothetical protein ACRDG7_00560 [Candidatus Limnocylindria bacterium]
MSVQARTGIAPATAILDIAANPSQGRPAIEHRVAGVAAESHEVCQETRDKPLACAPDGGRPLQAIRARDCIGYDYQIRISWQPLPLAGPGPVHRRRSARA